MTRMQREGQCYRCREDPSQAIRWGGLTTARIAGAGQLAPSMHSLCDDPTSSPPVLVGVMTTSTPGHPRHRLSLTGRG
jgi:hypothetical protein